MKKRIAIALILTLLFTGIAGAKAISLEAAIQTTAQEINAAFPETSRLAVVKFDSPWPALSEYIMEELTGRLVMGRKLTMVDRWNLEYIEKELTFQESNVSDETAQSVGKMLGAQSIITGSMVKTGNAYRWRINVLGVESAANQAAVLLDVLDNRQLKSLLASLESGKAKADTSYREIELTRIPQTAIDFLNRGLIFALRGDFDTALEDFSEAIKRDPNMALAYLLRGKTLFARQNRITSISEGFELVWTVALRAKTKDDETALADFTRAISLNPNLFAAYFYRGHLYVEIQEFDKAVADFTQGIRINPNASTGYNGRGVAYNDKGDYDRAIADYNAALKIDPSNTTVKNNLELALRQQGR
jgi:tetratricopeptide (TPR) repeat protein